MKLFLSSLITLFLLCSVTYAADYSDQQDALRMMDRMERLERDLTLLQRQVYSGTAAPAAPTTSGNEQPAEAGTSLARIEARIAEMEEQMRTLTGKIEEVEFANTKLSEKLDKVTADNEYRFKALEGNAGSAAPASEQPDAPVAHEEPASDAAASEEPKKRKPAISVEQQESSQEATASDSNKEHVLGKLPVKEGEKKLVVKEKAKEEASKPGKDATAEEQYKYAFSLVRAAKYDEAEAAFTQFIAENKKNPLTGGAYYWLGETYYAKNVYDKAAIQFLQSYKHFPTGKKAPESLLKLSMSLGKMKKRKEACSALLKLNEDFPNSSDALKQRAKEESTRFGCK